jgi:hypothetical protein
MGKKKKNFKNRHYDRQRMYDDLFKQTNPKDVQKIAFQVFGSLYYNQQD